MSLSESFGVITLMILLWLTGFSYYVEKFRLVERLLAWRWPRRTLEWTAVAGFLAGAGLLFVDRYLAALVGYLALLIWLLVNTDYQYRWMVSVIKTGLLLTLVYLILKYAERLSWWQWIRLRAVF